MTRTESRWKAAPIRNRSYGWNCPGSKRLFEIAESIGEIKSVCTCGAKATVNARLDDNGRIVTEGSQVLLGGNDRYVAMCRKCWLKMRAEQEQRPKNTQEKQGDVYV